MKWFEVKYGDSDIWPHYDQVKATSYKLSSNRTVCDFIGEDENTVASYRRVQAVYEIGAPAPSTSPPQGLLSRLFEKLF